MSAFIHPDSDGDPGKGSQSKAEMGSGQEAGERGYMPTVLTGGPGRSFQSSPAHRHCQAKCLCQETAHRGRGWLLHDDR